MAKQLHIDVKGPVSKEELLRQIKRELDREHPQDLIDSDSNIFVKVETRSAGPQTPRK